ncbi:GH25 family lysozyme [Paenarthrobacter nitroguajacolicus]|uniref:GH25 family lysozyme n=1 Tax=Paenarthrobacter nitroguajacolicus TaxID=211146 RepID=UPI004054559D
MKTTVMDPIRRIPLARAGLALTIALVGGSCLGTPAWAQTSGPQPAPHSETQEITPSKGPRPAADSPDQKTPGSMSPSGASVSSEQARPAAVEPSPALAPLPTEATTGQPGGTASESPVMPGTATDAEAMKAAMRAAIPAGGAEMGQRSPRVTAAKQQASPTTGARAIGGAVDSAVPMAADPGHWRPTIGIAGQDVSAHQGNVNWQSQWNQGSRWAYVKASEGNYYLNENYTQQYNGSRDAGMVRGAYHFAIPNWSSGADQARYFVANGGGWTADGYTLPPVLDIEYNPYAGRTINGFYFGNTCYDMSKAQLGQWAADFGNTVKALTGRFPVVYSTTDWWNTCVGNSTFGSYPLWIASYWNNPTNSPGTLPASWGNYSMWQYSSTGPFEGDSNIFNGSYDQLRTFARGITYPSNPSIKSSADILTTNQAGRLDAFQANGAGRITGPVAVGSGWSGATAMSVVDWNQDGVQDILSQWSDGTLKVFRGAPGGSFYAPIQVGSGWQEMSLTVGWWDSKAAYPGVVGQDHLGNLYRYSNAGGAGLGNGVLIGTGFRGHQLNQLDFDGDGSQDIVTRTTDGTMRLFRSNGLGTFISEPSRVIGSGWAGMSAVGSSTNFSGAGSQGLTARASNGDLYYYPLRSGAWGDRSLIGLGWNDSSLVSGVSLDVETTLGIDQEDVLAVRDANLYRYPGSGTTALLPEDLIGTGWSGLNAGFVTDWNGDGALDIVAQWSDGRLNVYPGRSGSGFGSAISLGSNWKGWTLSVGTWKKADAYPGIVGYDTTGRLFYFSNPAGKTVGTGVSIGVGWTGLEIVQMDFDKDSNADLLAKNGAGDLKLYRSNGTGNLMPESPGLVGTGWNIISSFGAVRGFAGADTSGIIAKTTIGELRYYPVGSNRSWGSPTRIGTGWNGLTIFAPAAK